MENSLVSHHITTLSYDELGKFYLETYAEKKARKLSEPKRIPRSPSKKNVTTRSKEAFPVKKIDPSLVKDLDRLDLKSEDQTRTSKVRYSITPLANKKLMRSYIIVKDLCDKFDDLSVDDMSKKDFEKLVIKPIETLIGSKAQVRHSNSFSKKRYVTSSFVAIHKRLKKEGVNLDLVQFDEEEETSSLASASRMLRLYVSHFDLKGGRKTLRFSLDSFLSRQFDEKRLKSLYEKNGENVITQGQIQTLASLLVGPMVVSEVSEPEENEGKALVLSSPQPNALTT